MSEDLLSMANGIAPITFRTLSWLTTGAADYTLNHRFGSELLPLLKQKFLCYVADFATTLPCFSYDERKCDKRCSLQLQYSEEDECFLAYCFERNTPDVKVQEEELKLFTSDMPKVLRQMAETLQLRPFMENLEYDVWLFGELSTSASRKYPVFFVGHLFQNMLQETISNLLLQHSNTPIVIFTVLDFQPNAQLLNIIKTKRCLILNIDHCLTIENNFAFTFKIPRKDIFESLTNKNQKTLIQDNFGFDFPAGMTWEDLNIHILDGETVSFFINNTSSKHTRSNMHLTKALWELLLSFSLHQGRLPSTNILQNEYMKKRRVRLNQELKKYCRTSEDAIVLSDDSAEYICRFKINPEYKSTVYHKRKRKS